MDNAIDLHVHSTYSDGTYSVSELVEYAKNINLMAIALTDHDCIDGNNEMALLCKEAGIEFIPGVELSTGFDLTEEKNIEIHLLGYFVESTPEFCRYLSTYSLSREQRNKKMIEKLQAQGFTIDYSSFVQYFPKGILTRAHIARYLYDHKQVPSISAAFDRYIGDGCCCYVGRERIPAKDAIQLIHAAGGLAVVAHPTLYKLNYSGIHHLIKTLASYGLDGVEGIYSTYKNEESATLIQYAKEFGLLVSGGSDFHGANKPYLHLGSGRGQLHIPYSIYEQLYNAQINK